MFLLSSTCVCKNLSFTHFFYSLAKSLSWVAKMVAERFTVDLDKPLVFQVIPSITSFRSLVFFNLH